MNKPRRPSTVTAPTRKPATIKHGATWWGRRWIEALEHGSRDMVARLGKGRAYARDGHVHHLQVKPGQITATVTDDELESHRVTLGLESFDNTTWRRILHAMASQALNAAQLLNGEMPKDIDQVFRSCGKSLFPVDHHEIDADCSCEDWTSPCKHVAATHYVLGDALDRDPFLLFELRGRSKEQVLTVLDRARQSASKESTMTTDTASAHATTLTVLSATQFERGAQGLPSMRFDFDVASGHSDQSASLLRSLGKPASWNVMPTPAELLEPALRLASELALDVATASGHIQLREEAPAKSGKRRKPVSEK